MTRRLIGSETTGTDGSCNIPYTGTGAGIINIEAETTINGTTITIPLTLLDCLLYDDALTNAKWNTNYADVNVNREITPEGTKLYYSADSGTRYCNTVIGETRNWFDSTKKYQVELDFSFTREDTNSNAGLGFGDSHLNLHNLFDSGLSGSGHFKMITNGNTYQAYLDDVPRGSSQSITGTNGFAFHIYRTATLTFKNLTIIEI